MSLALVTGGSGFVGQWLVAALLARGQLVRILDIRPPSSTPAGSHYVQGSVLDPVQVRAALDGVDDVYHLAALPGMWMPDKNDFHAVNCVGTEVMIAAARERGVPRFLHCSTESILFGPSNNAPVVTENAASAAAEMPGAYTRSKMRAEQCARQAAASGYPVVIASPTMPIGRHERMTPPTAMLRYFLDRRVQIYLDFILNLVDVRDVAAGLLLVMERGRPGERYILGGEEIALGALLERVAAISGRSAIRIPIGRGFAQLAAVTMEWIADYLTRRPPAATLEGVRIALHAKPLSIEKARRELGYAPRSIDLALREIAATAVGSARPFPAATSYEGEF